MDGARYAFDTTRSIAPLPQPPEAGVALLLEQKTLATIEQNSQVAARQDIIENAGTHLMSYLEGAKIDRAH